MDAVAEAHESVGIKRGMLDDRLTCLLRHSLIPLATRVTRAFEDFGLRSGSFTTMALISANSGCSQIDIAKEGHLDRSVVVGIVDELEKRGLAIRARSHQDRRRSSLYLTPAGELTLSKMYSAAMAEESEVRAAFSEDEMGLLKQFLDRISTTLQG